MPYIKNDGRREKLQHGVRALTAGELNYQIFYFFKCNRFAGYNLKYNQIKKYVVNFLGANPNYQKYNDMTGCLVRCAREIKRRLGIYAYILVEIIDSYDDEIEVYEDIKIKENGDV